MDEKEKSERLELSAIIERSAICSFACDDDDMGQVLFDKARRLALKECIKPRIQLRKVQV